MWDKERARRLEFTNSEEWAKSVLDILYQIRCNLFHGSKPFSEDQRVILIPCIHILETINDLLIKEIAPGQQHLK